VGGRGDEASCVLVGEGEVSVDKEKESREERWKGDTRRIWNRVRLKND
jgi:hypothetical protein